MPLLLVLHDGDVSATETMEQSVWQLSESHWVFGTGLLIVTGVSTTYLANHLTRALERDGRHAALMVTPVTKDAALDALPPEGRTWITSTLDALR